MDADSKKYKTILADPPWDINQRGNYGAIKHYNLMPIELIKAMPVADLCEENAHLYLWCPNGLIPQALEVIAAWGFRFRCTMVWCKPRLSCGHFIRTSHETLCFATRGKAPVKFHAQPSWVFAPQQKHSQKPEEQYPIIARLSEGPYLELFSRHREPGWDCWGYEAPGGSDIIIPDYPVHAYSDKVTKNKSQKEV